MLTWIGDDGDNPAIPSTLEPSCRWIFVNGNVGGSRRHIHTASKFRGERKATEVFTQEGGRPHSDGTTSSFVCEASSLVSLVSEDMFGTYAIVVWLIVKTPDLRTSKPNDR